MQRLLRSLRLPAHLFLSAVALLEFALFRRGGVLVFTHHPDVDGAGRDVQMGPLVDELRRRDRPLIEVTLVSLTGGLLRNLLVKRRPFVSHAALLAVARMLACWPGIERDRARDVVGRGLLRLLRPVEVFLIDESGSGQMLVRAARSLRIPTVGIQHGDFQRGNSQYGPASDAVPVDVLCLWSPWFRTRLLATSAIYGEHNTCVAGRMRYPQGEPARRPSERLVRVLLVSQADPGFRGAVEPFLRALRGDGGFRLAVRPHPGETPASWPAAELARAPLAQAIQEADVVVGVDSSALLEALWWHRPTVTLVALAPEPPAPLVACAACGEPEGLSDLCRTLARDPRVVDERRALVWGGPQAPAVEGILAAAQERRNALRSAA